MGFGSMALRHQRGGFSPLNIPAVKHWWAADGVLWQDTGRTVPAAAHGDMLGAVDDLVSGGANAAAPDAVSRVQLAIIGGVKYFYFWTGPVLQTGSIQTFTSKRGCIFATLCTHGHTQAGQAVAATFPGAGSNFLAYESDSGGTAYKFYDGAHHNAGAFDVADTPYVLQYHRTGDTTLNYYRNALLADALTVGNNQPAANVLALGGTPGSLAGGLYGLVRDWIVTDDITDGQRQQILNFLLSRRPPVLDTVLGFGDSVTNAIKASDPAHAWLHLVAMARGWALINSGVNSTVLQNTTQNTVATVGGAVNGNGQDNLAGRVTQFAPKYVFVQYGLNDLRLNDAAFTATTFQTSLTAVVQAIISSGVAAGNIVIGSPSYIPVASYSLGAPYDGGSTAKHTAIVAKCALVATAKSTKYIDVYQWMIDHGGDTLIDADGIHPNDAGNQAIANAYMTVI